MFGFSFYSSQPSMDGPPCLHVMDMKEAGRLLNNQFQDRVTTVVVWNSENRPHGTGQEDIAFFLVPQPPHLSSRPGHWVCLDSSTNGVIILDSCASSGNDHNNYVEEAVMQYYRCASSSVEIEESPQQTGDTACGYYAIANAVQLLTGLSVPSKYNQERMPAHLKWCFEKKIFKPFT